jgi:hypothetical protein
MESVVIGGSAVYLKLVKWNPPEFFDHATLE